MKTNKAKSVANSARNRRKAQVRKTRENSKRGAFLSCVTRPLHRMPVLDLVTPDGLEASSLVLARLDKLGALSKLGHKMRVKSAIEAAWDLANNNA